MSHPRGQLLRVMVWLESHASCAGLAETPLDTETQ
jgi:hypothetical protein